MTSTPDLTAYRAVHTALRRGTWALAHAAADLDTADARRVKAFARYWKGFEGEVLAHHTIEDHIAFPALTERVPVAVELIGRTDADHEHLDELMTAVAAEVAELAARRSAAELAPLLTELAELMDAHLSFEDADILPLFERHFTGEEWEELDAKAAKELGITKQAAFTIPFVASMLDPGQFEETLAGAPLPFRLLYKATRRSHAKLVALALGPAADRAKVAA